MLRTVFAVIPAESLPRTRSGAGIHCPAVRHVPPVNDSAHA